MSTMAGMPMAGGWAMPMTSMRAPGEIWLAAAASFLATWMVMMVAMMLPSHAPMLWRWRQAGRRRGEAWPVGPMATLGAAYMFVWAVVGMAVFSLGAALVAVETQLPPLARAAPMVAGAVVLIAGAVECTAWKARHLACWRHTAGRGGTVPNDAGAAWRYGLQLGLHCVSSSAGPTIVLLAIGMMDVRAMLAVTAAITAERLAPAGARVARVVGIAYVAGGMVLIGRAAGLV